MTDEVPAQVPAQVPTQVPAQVTAQFEDDRDRLEAMAFRILGSRVEAEDAVQETWLRLHRTGAESVDNLGGWLTTVVSRVCLDMLRARRTTPEDPAELTRAAESAPAEPSVVPDPVEHVLMADAIGPALMVVLDTLGPSERLAFVLHDLFAIPFADVATILGGTPDNARQLASRARRKVRGQAADRTDPARQREVVAAFLAASREGDFDRLLSLLAPDAVLRSDPAAVAMGSQAVTTGGDEVARTFAGRAKAAQLSLVDGLAGAVWSLRGEPKVVFAFTLDDGTITGIELLADPETIGAMELERLEA